MQSDLGQNQQSTTTRIAINSCDLAVSYFIFIIFFMLCQDVVIINVIIKID